MTIQIFKKPDGMYDCFDKETGKWLISRLSPDNIFSWLSEQKESISIEFNDGVFGKQEEQK